jgi:sugar phosphate isomerase/epimerase
MGRQRRAAADEVGSPALVIVLDPANLFEVAEAAERRRLVDEAVGLLGDRIAMAHAKDRHADGRFATAGKGVIDFQHFLGALRGVGFDGDLVTHGWRRQRLPGWRPSCGGWARDANRLDHAGRVPAGAA